jgi:hypothetical protein
MSTLDMIMNDPYIYISPDDKYVRKFEKDMICSSPRTKIGNERWDSGVSNCVNSGTLLISYCLI